MAKSTARLLAFLLPMVVETTVLGAEGGYGPWETSPGVFTWAGGSSAFQEGTFNLFDCKTGEDSGVSFQGDEAYLTIPGNENRYAGRFWWIFSASARSADFVSLYSAPGYVLRFSGDAGTAGTLTAPFGPFVLGGLIVESGASGYGLASSDEDTVGTLAFGDTSYRQENRLAIEDDFSITRTGPVEFLGRVGLTVAENKTLSVKGQDGRLIDPNPATPAELKLCGEGTFKCSTLLALGPTTLDFSEQSLSRDRPFVDGNLDIDSPVRLALPAGLAADTPYALCTEYLKASDGVRAIALGDGEYFLANLTFDATTHSVRYTTAEVNHNKEPLPTVSRWSDIVWASGYDANRPTELTITNDVRLSFDVSGANIGKLLIVGEGRLSIVPLLDVQIGDLYLGRETACSLVYTPSCEWMYGKDFSVSSSTAYDTVIEGPDAPDPEKTGWSGRMQVSGRLTTHGYLAFSNPSNRVDEDAHVLVADGRLSMGGALHAFEGNLTVAEKATFALLSDDFNGVNNGAQTFDIRGELALGEHCFTMAAPAALDLTAGAAITGEGTNGCALCFAGPVAFHVLSNVTAHVATLSAAVRYESPMTAFVDDGVTLVAASTHSSFTSAEHVLTVSGGGCISLGDAVAMQFAPVTFCTNGLVGAGTAVFVGDTPETPGLLAALEDNERWSGTCWLRGALVDAFDPNVFGNTLSIVALEGCAGSFADEATCSARLKLASTSAAYPASFTLAASAGRSAVHIDRLIGDGSLVLDAGADESRCRVFLGARSDYSGSFVLRGEDNANAIVIGAVGAEEEAMFENLYDGQIAVLSGNATIGAEAVWDTVNGLYVKRGAMVDDRGRITGPVCGDGTVKYADADTSSGKPEATAGYDNAANWTGTVRFEDFVFNDGILTNAGNVQSKIVLKNSCGSLVDQTILSEVSVEGTGFRVQAAADDAIVTFAKLSGDGGLSLDYGSAGEGSAYRALDISDFDGSLSVNTTHGSILLGDIERTQDGALEIADGLTIKSERNWTTPKAKFGSTLKVNGAAGDSLFKVTGRNVDFSYVSVSLVGAGDARRRFVLDYDGVTQLVFLSGVKTLPSMEVKDVQVVYGVDMTNATVSLSVTNYWGGYAFSGESVAEIFVQDAYGNLVGYGSARITGDGTYVVGGFNLPASEKGNDYRYDVVVTAEDTTSGESKTVDGRSLNEPVVHWNANWFSENAQTFAATDPKDKTGTWKYAAGEATVYEDRIYIDTTETGGHVNFKPYREAATNHVVKTEALVTFNGPYGAEYVPETELPTNRLAGLTVVEFKDDAGDRVNAYAVWISDPTLLAGGSFQCVYGNEPPVFGTNVAIGVTINYDTGYACYAVNGSALTNEAGVALFPVYRLGERMANAFNFTGQGTVDAFVGDQWNGNLAKVVSGGVTNEYASVDEAVAEAMRGGVTNLVLLWDASWRPLAEDVGKTLVFDLDGHRLVIDGQTTETLERGGYRVIDNGDGSYTIGVIAFELTFDGNGATGGTMTNQPYSVTNMVFNLLTNAYVCAGRDFAAWNVQADGSGATNWTDGALIDMTPFGLTNMTLYARWKVSIRKVTIEAGDEYVYIEHVSTNGTDSASVCYAQPEACRARATGKAVVSIEHGSDLIIRFSTDIERALTYDVTNLTGIVSAEGVTIVSNDLPKILNDLSPHVATALQLWAAKNSIPASSLSSPYAAVSCALDLTHVITESSEIRISDFQVTEDGCSFAVSIDDDPVTELSKILPMVRISNGLESDSDWKTPGADVIKVDADGRVDVKAGPSAFVKIVIPKGD